MSADSSSLEAIVGLFGVLEVALAKYVRLTTLSKVLHGKRPT